MKYYVFVLLILFSATDIFALDQVIRKGENIVSLNLGFGSDNFKGKYFIKRSPLLSVSYERGVMDSVAGRGSIGVGGLLGICTYKRGNTHGGYTYNDLVMAGRGTFHYPFIPGLDTYTGMILGFNFSNTGSYGDPPYDFKSNDGLIFGWFVGAKYYFTDKLAGQAEVGVGMTYVNIGLAFRF
jgi:hypothetical protein